MASKTFRATWMGQYTASNAAYYGASNPIRVGGSSWFHSYLGIDKTGILNAINTSKTAARVYLNIYVTNYGEFDIGFHKEGFDKKSNGMPFYRYANIHPFLNTGWRRIDITDASLQNEPQSGFKNIMNAGYTGPVLYGGKGADQGEAYGVTNNQFHIYIEVTGTWNTAPGAPGISAPTAGQSVDKTFELKGTHASDAEQSSSGLRYEWGINDGTGWKYLGFGSYGVVNKVVDFSTYQETTQAQVALRANDGALTGPWAYSSRFTISHNKPPGSPQKLSPANGAQRDRTQNITFTWEHNDADGQSAYEFRWRLQGNTLWTESGKTSTSNRSLIVAANTFPQGPIEWQVRTYDQESLVGPWSATAIFNATEPSDAPVITSPTMSQSIPTSRINVSWTAPEQEEYELQLVSSENQILWSETQISNNRVVEVPYDLSNNSTYTLRLRTKLQSELWSSWAETTFITSFTTPAIPEVNLFEWVDEGAVDIRINNPLTGAVGEPNVTANDIYRRIYATDAPFIRIAAGVSNNGVFRDYTPASGVTYEYYVRAWGDNGTFQDSYSNTIMITIENTMISIASNPTRFVRLQYNPKRSISHEKDRTLLKFNGRVFPVAEFGVQEDRGLSLSFAIRERTTLEVLLDIVDSKETLLYRDSRGRREFVTVKGLDVNDRFPDGYSVNFNPDTVEYIEEV